MNDHPDPIGAWIVRIYSAAAMLFVVSAVVPVGFFIAMRALQDHYDGSVVVRVETQTEVSNGR